ncbi:MAG TPA: hypothetical protein VNG34_06625 [Actinomycetota bacterium]|nr:hypothetical protein [Actinomycetota bacterium]
MPEGLDDRPFSYRVTKDRRVLASYRGRQVTVVAGKAAERLIAALETADEDATQHLLARVTGNFKRGNERSDGPNS